MYYPNSLVLNVWSKDHYNNYWLVFNKLDKRQVFKLKQVYKGLGTINALSHLSCDSNDCNIPEFVHQMDDKLFAQIEGVVDFNKEDKSGYFLLLNISGRPMTCYTFQGEGISEMVRH